MARKASDTVEVSGVQLPKVSGANTKAEILDAYQAVVAKFEEKVAGEPASPKAAADERRRVDVVLEKAKISTVEGVIRSVAELKLDLASALDKLSEQLVSSTQQYAVLQQALDLGARQLEEVYDIKVSADALGLLIHEHEGRAQELETTFTARRAGLEVDIQRTRQAWDEEKAAHESSVKARDSAQKQARQREEEEYQYDRDRHRQRDTDAYQEKKAALEKELVELRRTEEFALSERERRVAQNETELTRLSEEVTTFPKRLEQAVQQAVTETEKRLRAEAKVTSDIADQKSTAASELATLRIKTLESALGEKEARIQELQKQVEEATQKVSQIALQAIEGASGSKALKHVNQIALEQAKHRPKE